MEKLHGFSADPSSLDKSQTTRLARQRSKASSGRDTRGLYPRVPLLPNVPDLAGDLLEPLRICHRPTAAAVRSPLQRKPEGATDETQRASAEGFVTHVNLGDAA